MMALLDLPLVYFVILLISLSKQNQTPAQIYKSKGWIRTVLGEQRTNTLSNIIFNQWFLN